MKPIIYLILLFIIIYFRENINKWSISTMLICIFSLLILNQNFYYYENMTLSNESIQNISSIIDNGIMIVDKSYCVNDANSKECITYNDIITKYNGVNLDKIQ